ncbi:MAG TPA: DUF1616 domain-containing protein [Candidatus Bathyarchaeia archaeon]|nr:DUF1616 domain-containing protein [Candidatus Bathyarchaeia archaeon]
MQPQRDSPLYPREVVENTLRSRHPATVQQLAQIVTTESDLSEQDVVQIVKEMARDGTLVLEEPLRVLASPWDYFLIPTLSLWFWTAFVATVLAVNIVLFIPNFFPVVAIRWLSGSILLLFLPGYASLRLLFPVGKGSLEQFILSIGLSLAIVPLIGLALTHTPWGIGLVPVTGCIAVFTIALLTAATWRASRHVIR